VLRNFTKFGRFILQEIEMSYSENFGNYVYWIQGSQIGGFEYYK
jgi:hypothetical protein